MDSSRYEIKFVVNDVKLAEFFSWMWTCTSMKHAYPQRVINSLYFDDARFNSLRDNLAGLSDREKFRLRWYSDSAGNEVNDLKLEKKVKEGRLGFKKTTPLINMENELLDSSIGDIQTGARQQFVDLGLFESNLESAVFPVLLVQYARQYFQDPDDIRITVDEDIRFHHVNSSDRLFANRPIPFSKKIIEIKFAPDNRNRVASMLRSMHLVPQRCSKYLQGMAMNGMAVYL